MHTHNLQLTNCVLHLRAYLAALPTHAPEWSPKGWSRNGVLVCRITSLPKMSIDRVSAQRTVLYVVHIHTHTHTWWHTHTHTHTHTHMHTHIQTHTHAHTHTHTHTEATWNFDSDTIMLLNRSLADNRLTSLHPEMFSTLISLKVL